MRSGDPRQIDHDHFLWSTLLVSDPLYDEGLPVEFAVEEASKVVGATMFGPSGRAISVAQERKNWCWAASVQMLRRVVGLAEKEQCEVAAKRLDKSCCLTPDVCDVRLALDHLTNLLVENGMRSQRERAQLAADTFWAELYARRPILLADIFENGSDGHVRVAFGFQRLRRGGLVVRVADPAEAKKAATPFEELQKSRWRETWYQIEVLDGAS